MKILPETVVFIFEKLISFATSSFFNSCAFFETRRGFFATDFIDFSIYLLGIILNKIVVNTAHISSLFYNQFYFLLLISTLGINGRHKIFNLQLPKDD